MRSSVSLHHHQAAIHRRICYCNLDHLAWWKQEVDVLTIDVLMSFAKIAFAGAKTNVGKRRRRARTTYRSNFQVRVEC